MSSHDHAHDNWFSHAANERPQAEQTQVVNSLSLFKWFLATIIFLAVVIASLFAYFDNYTARLRAGQITRPDGTPIPGVEVLLNAEYNATKAAADEALGIRDGHVVDSGTIDKAMKKVVTNYSK